MITFYFYKKMKILYFSVYCWGVLVFKCNFLSSNDSCESNQMKQIKVQVF